MKISYHLYFTLMQNHPVLEIQIQQCQESSGLGGLVVSALDFQAGYRGFESRSGQDKFHTISTPSSYSTCSGLSTKWTGRRLVTDSSTKCAWVIHESKVVQIHVHNNRRCPYVPRVPGSVKNLHNNNNQESRTGLSRRSYSIFVLQFLSSKMRTRHENCSLISIILSNFTQNVNYCYCCYQRQECHIAITTSKGSK